MLVTSDAPLCVYGDRRLTRVQRKNSLPDVPDARPRLDIVIETVWLLALGPVPVMFSGPDLVVLFSQPKDFVLRRHNRSDGENLMPLKGARSMLPDQARRHWRSLIPNPGRRWEKRRRRRTRRPPS